MGQYGDPCKSRRGNPLGKGGVSQAAIRYAKACLPDLAWRGRLLTSALALLMAQLTFWLLENPVRFNPILVARPLLSLGLAALVPAVGVMIALSAGHVASVAIASNPRQQQIEIASDAGPWRACLVLSGISKVTECVFGDRLSKTKVVLFGDSHAGQWFSAVNSFAGENHWQLVTLLKANCQVAARETDSSGRVVDTSCEAWRASALERIASLHPAIVVLGESAASVGNPRMSAQPVTPRQWGDGLLATLRRLDTIGTRTLVIADVPHSSFDVPVCLSRWTAAKAGAKPCVITRETGLNSQVRDREMAAVADDPSARWLDLSDLFCLGSRCQTIIDDVVAYRDDNHVSEVLARHLAPRFLYEIDLLARIPSAQASADR